MRVRSSRHPALASTLCWLLLLALIIGTRPMPAHAQTIPDVPTFRADPQRTGVMPGPAPTTTPIESWRAPIGPNPYFFATPVVANGLVVFGGSTAVYAFDAITGETKWSFPVPGLSSSPAVDGGVVYIGNERGALYAIDLETGVQKWQFADPQGAQIGSSPVVVDGIVYVGVAMADPSAPGSGIDAVDAATGALLWSAATNGQVYASPAVAEGLVVVGDFAGSLYAFDAATGSLVWQTMVTSGARLQSSPAIANGRVFVGCCANQLQVGYLLTFDLRTGEEGWAYQTSGDVIGSPAVAANVVYFGSLDGSLYAVSQDGISLVWTIPTPAMVAGSPAVVEGTVVFTASDGTLRAVDGITGDPFWQIGFDVAFGASPVVSGGMIYLIVDQDLVALAAGVPDMPDPNQPVGAAVSTPITNDTATQPAPSSSGESASCDPSTFGPAERAYAEQAASDLTMLQESLDRALAGIFDAQSLDNLRQEAPAWNDLQARLAVADAAGAVPSCFAEFHSLLLETVTTMTDAADAFISGEATDDEAMGIAALDRLQQAKAMLGILQQQLG